MNQRLKTTDYFSTSDLALAALITLYYPVDTIDRSQNPYKAQFLFKKDNQLDRLVEAYWKGEIQVEPQAFFNSLKNIKTRLYSEITEKRNSNYLVGGKT